MAENSSIESSSQANVPKMHWIQFGTIGLEELSSIPGRFQELVPEINVHEIVEAESIHSSSVGGDVLEINEQVLAEAESSRGGGDALEIHEQVLVKAECSTGGGDVPEINGQILVEAESSTGGGDALEVDKQVHVEAESSSGGDILASNLRESVDSWHDTTSCLVEAFKDMGNDELIHKDNFDISSMMHAVKAIHQKLGPNLVTTNYSVDEAIKNGGAPVLLSSDRKFYIQCVIDVMDHLLVCEVTGHEMETFAQTVHSCFYTSKIVSSDALLHSFCGVTILTCNAISSAVDSSNKEDGIHNLYYRSDSDEEKYFLSMLKKSEETISRQLHAPPKARLSKREISKNHYRPFRILKKGSVKLYYAVYGFVRPQGAGLDLAKKHITSCLAELKSIVELEGFLRSNSSCRGIQYSVELSTTASGCQPVGFGSPVNFSHVNGTDISEQYLALTRACVPKLLNWQQAVGYFRKLLYDLEVICCNPLHTDLEGVMSFMLVYQDCQPGWVATAHAQLLLVQDGKLYGREAIFAVICKAALLPERAKYFIQKCKDVELLEKLFCHFLKALCFRISIQRNMFAKTMRDWEIVIQKLTGTFKDEFGDLKGTPTDENLFNVKICNHILGWADHHKHWKAWQFLMRGFSLDIYSTDEYCMIYWCIWVMLTKFTEAKMCLTKLKNESRPSKATNNIESKDDTLLPNDILLGCYCNLALGLFRMLAILRNEHNGLLSVDRFNSEGQRFIQHFKPLYAAGYELSYSKFKEDVDRADISTSRGCFSAVSDNVKTLQIICGDDLNRLDMIGIQTVAKRNTLALDILGDNVDPTFKISLDFSHHRYYAVAKLTRS